MCVCVSVFSSQASLSTRRSSHVPSDTPSRPAAYLHRDSTSARISYQHLQQAAAQQQQQQQAGGGCPRKSPLSESGSAAELPPSLQLSTIPPSLAAAYELPGIHISRIETLDFDDDAISRSDIINSSTSLGNVSIVVCERPELGHAVLGPQFQPFTYYYR